MTTPQAPTTSAERDAEVALMLARIAEEPYRYDLWQLLRWLDAKHPDAPPLGRAPVPELEPLRIGQEPSPVFAPAQVFAMTPDADGGRPRLTILGFGLFGPNGPLPSHLTEYARERMRTRGDRTLVRFLDMFHHRFTLLFYRAWADSQSAASLDRPAEDRFSRYCASLIHLGESSLRDRDEVPDHAKLFCAGHLARDVRNAEGLEHALAIFFETGVRIEQWVSQWLTLAPPERTRLGLGRVAEKLGVGAVVGERVPDVQSRFRIWLGAMSLAEYESHLPGGRAFRQVLAWLREYVGYETDWDVRLVLRRDEVPRAALGSTTRLGWTTWLGTRSSPDDAADLVLVHETIAARTRLAAAA